MNLCSGNHDEVCYEGRTCPACAALADKDEEIAALEKKLESAREEIESLENQ